MRPRKHACRAGTALLAALLVPLVTLGPGAARADTNPEGGEPPPAHTLALPQLQLEAAKVQARFVRASLDLDVARRNLRLAQAELRQANAAATAAQALADAESDRLATYIGLLYIRGPALDPSVQLLISSLDQDEVPWQQNMVFQHVTGNQVTTVEIAEAAQAEADRIAGIAEQQQTEATDAEDEVQRILGEIQARADEVSEAAEATISTNVEAALFDDAQQQARNASARRAWAAYKVSLRTSRTARPVKGKASRAGKRTLPRPAIKAVDRALAALGRPYVAGNAGPQTYDCAGLVQAIYPDLKLGTTPAASFERTRVVRRSKVRPGDLVYFDDADAGLHHVGIYLGGNLMVAADGEASEVAVLALPGTPYAVTRPSLRSPGPPHEAPTGDGSLEMSCGLELLAGGAASTGMVYPIAEEAFRFTSTFGQPGPHWASGFHTGLDFAAHVGTPVVAARDGVVSVSHPGWAGNLVTVDHGDDLASSYAHLSAVFVQPGQQVLAGQMVGAVGLLGNTTGPHLHFEVAIAGTQVDPMMFLSGFDNDTAQGWGGFTNGMIPASELCALAASPVHRLRCDAAKTYDALNLAHRAAFGQDICITDSYRSFALQVATFANKPSLAAVPGTSNHGWGLAVDLCGGIEDPGSPQHAWLQENGRMFGWFHPDWAEPGGSRPEPWHWEFGHTS